MDGETRCGYGWKPCQKVIRGNDPPIGVTVHAVFVPGDGIVPPANLNAPRACM